MNAWDMDPEELKRRMLEEGQAPTFALTPGFPGAAGRGGAMVGPSSPSATPWQAPELPISRGGPSSPSATPWQAPDIGVPTFALTPGFPGAARADWGMAPEQPISRGGPSSPSATPWQAPEQPISRGGAEAQRVMAPNPLQAPTWPGLSPDSDGRLRVHAPGAGPIPGSVEGQVVPDPWGGNRGMVVPKGVEMVPVQGLSQGRAFVGMNGNVGPLPDAMNLAPDIGRPQYTPEGMLKAPDLTAALANSGVLRASQAEKDTLNRMRAGSGSASPADRRLARLEEESRAFDRAQRGADLNTDRKIREAQNTPQGVAGAAGVATWDPFSQTWTQEVRQDRGRLTAENLKKIDPDTGMSVEQLFKHYRESLPRKANDLASQLMLSAAIQAANGDPAKIKQAQEMYSKDDPGRPELSAWALARLKALGVDPTLFAGSTGEATPAASVGIGGATAPTVAGGAPKAAGTAPKAGSVMEKFKRG